MKQLPTSVPSDSDFVLPRRYAFLLIGMLVAQTGWAAPVVADPQARPNAIQASTSTPILVSAIIRDSNLIYSSVNVIDVSVSSVSSIVGQLNDAGLDGDLVAGDQTYSGRMFLSPAIYGTKQLKVSAAFRGFLARTLSEPITIWVLEADRVVHANAFGISFVVPSGWDLFQRSSPDPLATADATTLTLVARSPSGSTFAVLPRGEEGFDDNEELPTVNSTLTIGTREAWRVDYFEHGTPIATFVGIPGIPGFPRYRIQFTPKNSSDQSEFENLLRTVTLP